MRTKRVDEEIDIISGLKWMVEKKNKYTVVSLQKVEKEGEGKCIPVQS